jgi:hypothetical protein
MSDIAGAELSKRLFTIIEILKGIKRFLFQITFEVLRLEGEEGSLCCHLQHNSN